MDPEELQLINDVFKDDDKQNEGSITQPYEVSQEFYRIFQIYAQPNEQLQIGLNNDQRQYRLCYPIQFTQLRLLLKVLLSLPMRKSLLNKLPYENMDHSITAFFFISLQGYDHQGQILNLRWEKANIQFLEIEMDLDFSQKYRQIIVKTRCSMVLMNSQDYPYQRYQFSFVVTIFPTLQLITSLDIYLLSYFQIKNILIKYSSQINAFKIQKFILISIKIMNTVFSWLKEKVVEPFKADGPVTQNPHFRLDQGIVTYITIEDTRLYFQQFNPKQTVKTLQDQFQKFHKRQLFLENKEVKISPDMPLCQVINSSDSRQIFQNIVNKIDKKEEIKIDSISVQKRQQFKKIVKTCNEFSSYQCKIFMENGPQRPMKIDLTIDQKTSFNQIIKQMNSCPLIIGEDIEFRSQQKKFLQKDYNKTFQTLNIRQKHIYANYSSKNSYLRGNSKIIIPDIEEGIQINQLKQNKIKQIISYDSQGRMFNVNKITNIQQNLIKKYYRLSLSLQYKPQLSQQDKQIIFECTGSVRIFVLTKDFQQIWVPVNRLGINDQIGGVNPRKGSFVLYKINTIQQLALQVAEQFFGIQVVPSHQYIANNIIVHNNNDKFLIKAYHIKGEEQIIENVQFQRNQLISGIFGNKICKIGGKTLRNDQTFGDYQLEQFRAIYIYDNKQSLNIKRKEYTISEWKKETISNQQISEEYKKKLQEGYLGIYQQRIVHPKQIQEIYTKQGSSNVNILVGIRTYFQKINYFINKQPKFLQNQTQQSKKYWQIMSNDNTFKKILSKILKQGIKMSGLEILGIFLYTTDNIYGQLNKYLRDLYMRDSLEQDRKYLPLTGWIWKSIKKTQLIRGVVYRGIRNIDIKKAFKLQTTQQDQARQKVVIFTSFTSTSLSKKEAEKFAHQATSSLLLTIHMSSGRSIQKYSQFPTEKQVLLEPFTYFVINKYDAKSQRQTAEIQQIPMPQKDSKKIIFWVDDQPDNNKNIIKYVFEKQGIEVVQVTNTRIMKIILKNFFWIFKMLGSKVVIISDMGRLQQGKHNPFAGIDLFYHIYNEYGLSNKAIIFTDNRKLAYQKLEQRKIKGDWAITVQSEDLVREVMSEFQKME